MQNARRSRAARRPASRAGDLLEAPPRLVQVGEHELLRNRRPPPPPRATARRAPAQQVGVTEFVTAGAIAHGSARQRASTIASRKSSKPSPVCADTRHAGQHDRHASQAAGRSLLFATTTRATRCVSLEQRLIVVRERPRPVEHDDSTSAAAAACRARAMPSASIGVAGARRTPAVSTSVNGSRRYRRARSAGRASFPARP